jgi:hypothetical protein
VGRLQGLEVEVAGRIDHRELEVGEPFGWKPRRREQEVPPIAERSSVSKSFSRGALQSSVVVPV